MSAIQTNPYIGPRTFQRNEGHLFFGREREARDLIALVASERLVVFYAQSGAGKSSIVNTRLIPNLESKEYEVLPVGRLSGDLTAGEDVDNIYVHNLIRSLEQHDTDPQKLAGLTISDFLAHINYDDKGFFYDPTPVEADPASDPTEVARRALIIDQFEEVFSTYPESWEKRDDFFVQLAKAMEDDPQLWVVLVMREDYIAALDPYAHIVSNGLRVRYYMQRLGRDSALKAVKSPVEEIRPYAEGVAEKLIDDLCSIKVQKPDGTLDIQPGQYAEPVQMQVVCYGLWDNLPTEGTQISAKDLQDVGDVNQSLGKYYDKRVGEVAKAKNVRERLIREWFEKKLITTGGIRNMVLQEHETKPGELDDHVIQALQSDLVRAEKRGGATWYELTHDRLVEPVVERNKIWFAENLSPLQRQAALWKDQDQNETWLLTGDALSEVEKWAKEHKDELTETEEEFLAACQKAQAQIDERNAAEHKQLDLANKLAREQARSAKRARRFNYIAIGLVVIAVFATIYAFGAKASADQAAKDSKNSALAAKKAETDALHQSDIAHSSELSTVAIERSSSELDVAMLLGIRANSFDSNAQSQKSLLTLLQKSSHYQGVIKKKEGEEIRSIQYSPDGKTLVTLGKDGITLWNAQKKTRLNASPLTGHFGAVSAMAISQDRKLMASGGADGTIVIWDVGARNLLSKPIEAHSSNVTSLAFSPDENAKLLASGSYDGAIFLWDISDPANPQRIGKPLTEQGSGYVYSIAFSPDGKILASSNSTDYNIILWDVETHAKIGNPLKGHSSTITALVFSSDKKTLASDSYNAIFLWDISDPTTASSITTFTDPASSIEKITISPNGKTLASGDDAGNILLWDIPTRTLLTETPLNGETSWLNSLAFSPDGKTLASGSSDGKVSLWDLSDPTSPAQIGTSLEAHTNTVAGMAFSTTGTLITASYDSTIIFWDISKPKNPEKIGEPLHGHPGSPDTMSFSPDGSLVASVGTDGTVLFDVKTQQPLGFASVSTEYGTFLTSPDKGTFVYQILDQKTNQSSIHILNAKTSEPIVDPIVGQAPVFSPDGKKLVFQTVDQAKKDGLPQLHILDLASAPVREETFAPSSAFSAFSPDGRILVYQTTRPNVDQETDTTYINLWDMGKWANVREAIEGSYSAFASDGQTLVYQTADPVTHNTFVNLLDIASAENLGVPVEGSYIAINADSHTLLTRTATNTGDTLTLWDIAKGVKIKSVTSKTDAHSVSKDGKVLAWVSSDSQNPTINILDTATGNSRIATPLKGDAIYALSENGKVLLYSSTAGTNAASVNALNTLTGAPIGTPVIGNIDPYYGLTTQSTGPFLAYNVYSNYYSGSGEYKFSVINTSNTTLLGNAIAGKLDTLNLAEDDSILIYQASNKLKLVNAIGGNTIQDLDGALLTINQDQGILVYQTNDNNNNLIKVWDIKNNRSLGEPIRGRFEALSPDGETLITRSETDALIFWNLTQTWPFGDLVREKNDNGTNAALSPDGKMLALFDGNGITLQDIAKTENNGERFPNTHVATVLNATLSPNKQTLVSLNDDSKAIVWDLKTLQPLSEPIPGNNGASFSPLGNYVYLLDYIKRTITLWSLTNHQTLGKPLPGQDILFSPDEKFAATREYYPNNTTILWDLTTKQAISFFKDASVAFSPDSKLAAITSNSSTTFFDLMEHTVVDKPMDGYIFTDTRLANSFIIVDSKNTSTFWDWKTRKPISKPISGTNPYFIGSADLPTLAVTDYTNSQTTLWNAVTHTQIGKTLAGTNSPSTSPDGTLISLADSNTNETIIWDLKAQKQIRRPLTGANQLTFCSDNKTLAWFDATKQSIVIWNLKNDQKLGDEFKLNSGSNGVGITFSPACDLVAIQDLTLNQTYLWDIKVQKLIGKKPVSGASLVLFSSDGSLMAVTNNNSSTTTFRQLTGAEPIDAEVKGANAAISAKNSDIITLTDYNPTNGTSTHTIWNLAKHKQIGAELIDSQSNLDFTTDGKLIVYGKNGVTFWDADAVDPEKTIVGKPLQSHTSQVNTMLFSPNGKVLASLASDGIVITDLDAQLSVPLPATDFLSWYWFSNTMSNTMAFSQDGKRLTALSRDGLIYVWDISSNPPVLQDPVDAPYKSFVNNLNLLALSLDANTLIYEFNGKLYIWNIGSKKFVGDPDKPIKMKACCGGVVTFSSDGKSLYYSDEGTMIHLDNWQQNPTENGRIATGQTYISSLSLVLEPGGSSEPRYMISSFGDSTAQVWNWAKETKIGDPILGNLQIFGANGNTQTLIYLNTDGKLIKWDLNPDTWVKLLCAKANRNLTKKEWDLYIGLDQLKYQEVCPGFSIDP